MFVVSPGDFFQSSSFPVILLFYAHPFPWHIFPPKAQLHVLAVGWVNICVGNCLAGW
jgi:hypothetical protein